MVLKMQSMNKARGGSKGLGGAEEWLGDTVRSRRAHLFPSDSICKLNKVSTIK